MKQELFESSINSKFFQPLKPKMWLPDPDFSEGKNATKWHTHLSTRGFNHREWVGFGRFLAAFRTVLY